MESTDNFDESRLLQPGTRRQKLFARVKNSMVAIALGFPDQRDVIGATKTPPSGMFRIVGSGFLVDRKHGLVSTAGHVVEQLKQARIAAELQEKPLPDWLCVPQQRGIIDGEGDFAIRFHSVYVKGFFHGGPPDVGVVEIDSEGLGAHNDSLELSAEPCLEGDAVFTRGYPLGLELHKNSTVNATFHHGIVSAILPSSNAPQSAREMLQLDIITLGGSSGGPVVSLDSGKVCGIVVKQLFNQVPLGPDPKSPWIKIPLGLTFAEDVQRSAKLLSGSPEVKNASCSASRMW